MSAPLKNRQILLKTRPTTTVSREHFDFVDSEVRPDAVPEGQVLVRTLACSIDPAMRGWLNDAKSYIPPVKIGEVMRSQNLCQVVSSKSSKFSPGEFVVATTGCQEYAIFKAKNLMKAPTLPNNTPMTAYLSVLGVTGLSAYFGFLDVGKPKAGDTVLISGAAGGVGSIVGQIAKIKGCTNIVGVAGSDAKCKWLVEELGFSAAINYKGKSEGQLAKAVKEACPKGIDIFFDNVGGAILDAALRNLRTKARVVLCGAISTYNNPGSMPPAGPKFYMSLLINRARMEGFVLPDYWSQAPAAVQELAQWLFEGKLKYREHIVDGLDSVPEAIGMLFKGANTGKMIVRVAHPAGGSKL